MGIAASQPIAPDALPHPETNGRVAEPEAANMWAASSGS